MKFIYEAAKIIVAFIIGAALVAFLQVNLHLFGGGTSSDKALDLSYSDLAVINLTVATVVLGGVALIVAVAAVFGFQVIRTESVSNAENRVKTELPDMLERELGRMEKDGRLKLAMERVIYSGGPKDDDGSQTEPEE
ncbi:hypothetical protein [Mesorhizobium sp. M2C.T.Ca.TU.002.02.1.1]|uniref:hypothetical protein n=1 Tax=Mesorhizobium sp. M2C.T.Ca.TU.002.02.1.1 TaxID=2496788 RepID=UPI000FC9C340|nr:hypothetical protein [Mesorhizobium sp. M2C.T.Ca.TU.002.02.1.1]RUU58235.1 hypothetical protein EOD07_10550 [Mesorhizobium sp. M2C.T.Ca.TU.002.02.1.1]RUU71614.1 hypothetical protein EOD04_02130 [Mesorhizobium sp. M2C.T.Ca.TU.009.01.2.1]